MPDSPSQDPGDGAVTPANQPETFDVESLLSKLTKTETGADSLARALKDRRTRDVLKQRGVKIQADDDVGYKSLPLELRDNIRRCAIASVQTDRDIIRTCGRCPRLAPYACIDSEWRDAVEPVTFQRLNLKHVGEKITKELKRLEHYVVGRRRKYLQQISLPFDSLDLIIGPVGAGDEPSAEDKANAFISPIRQLFNCIKDWSECGTGNGDLQVKVQTTAMFGWVAEPFSMPLERLHAGLTNLPTIPQITHFCVSIWQPLDVRSILILLSHMPLLRSTTVSLQTADLPDNAQNHGSQTQLFFNSLSQAAPNLEALEVMCNHGWMMDNIQITFCTAALSYSQRLRKFSLTYACLAGLRSILAPFSTANFNSESPPPLVWPDLTNFNIAKFDIPKGQDEFVKAINEIMLTVGRAIRYMPRIRNLEMGWNYYEQVGPQRPFEVAYTCGTDIVFNLESPQVFPRHVRLARLFATHHSPSMDLAEAVPSEEVRNIWRESLLQATGAVLEVQVNSKDCGAGLVSDAMGDEDTEED